MHVKFTVERQARVNVVEYLNCRFCVRHFDQSVFNIYSIEKHVLLFQGCSQIRCQSLFNCLVDEAENILNTITICG